MTAGRSRSTFAGKTVMILMPMWRSVCQAGMSKSVASAPPPVATPWWWRTGVTMSRRKAWRRRSTRLSKSSAASTSAAEIIRMGLSGAGDG